MGKSNEDIINSVFGRLPASERKKFLAKDIDASGLSTEEREAVGASINRRCFFSANIVNEKILEEMKSYIGKNLAGKKGFTRDGFVKDMLSLTDSVGLTAEEQEELTKSRLGLIFDTQKAMAQGEADYVFFENPLIAEAYPCQELVRKQWRKEPRDWIAIWSEAGGSFYDGRMIATRDDPIWLAISDFGNPYPPFKFNSGMGLNPIRDQEAIELGVVDEWYVSPPNKPLDDYEEDF